MHHLPCKILSIDVSDFMGTHTLNVQGTIVKSRLSKNGKTIETIINDSNNTNTPIDITEIEKAIDNEEGCRFVGAIEVLRVPGNFHISSHAYGKEIAKLLATKGNISFDLSHTINHISFGDNKDLHYIKHHFNDGNLNPLDGLFTKDEKNSMLFEYYLDIVPTTYVDLDNNEYHVHQFTSNKNKVKSGMLLPTIYFRYDISPILVKFKQYKTNKFTAIINSLHENDFPSSSVVISIRLVSSDIVLFAISRHSFISSTSCAFAIIILRLNISAHTPIL